MLLTQYGLHQAVRGHARGRRPFDLDSSFLDFLAEPVVVYINVSELGVKLCITLNQESNCLHIVAIDHLLLLSIKSDFLKESLLLN